MLSGFTWRSEGYEVDCVLDCFLESPADATLTPLERVETRSVHAALSYHSTMLIQYLSDCNFV